MKRRILSTLLALAMVCAMLPGAVFAADAVGYTIMFRNKETGEESFSLTLDFGTKEVGYTVDAEQDSKTVTLINKGSRALTFSGDLSSTAGFTADPATVTALEPGEEIDITFTLKEGLSAKSEPYKYSPSLISQPPVRMVCYVHLTVQVDPVSVNITPENLTKYYGETKSSSDVSFSVEENKFTPDMLGAVFTSSGFDAGANTGSYPYTIASSNANYDLVNTAPEAGVTVLKAAPMFITANATGIIVGETLGDSQLTGELDNPYTGEYIPGTFRWKEPEKIMTIGTSREEFIFTPDELTNYEVYEGFTEVIVSEKTPTNLYVSPSANLMPEYDGKPKGVAFDADRKGTVTVQYRPSGSGDESWTAAPPVNAGVYDVQATMEETEAYAMGLSAATLTIQKRVVRPNCPSAFYSKVYDGTNAVLPNQINGEIGLFNRAAGDTATRVRIKQSAINAYYENYTYGYGRSIVIIIQSGDDALEGTNAHNYTLQGGIYHAQANIQRLNTSIDIADLTKEYGQTLALDNSAVTGVPGGLAENDTVADLHVILTSDGTAAEAAVGTYPIAMDYSANLTSYAVTVSKAGSVTVTKATPANYGISAGSGTEGSALSTVALEGSFVNPNNYNMTVSGTLAWKAPNTVLTKGSGTYDWVFTPDDKANYNTVEGQAEVTVTDKPVASVNITLPTDLVYNGKQKAATATTNASGAKVTIEYAANSDAPRTGGASDQEWTSAAPVDAGAYYVRATATETSSYAGNSVTATMIIEQAEPQGSVTAGAVEAGSYLSEVPLSGSFIGALGEEVPGELMWTNVGSNIPSNVPVTNGTAYDWIFIPQNFNYKSQHGSAIVTVTPISRAPEAVIYNLPGDNGNYAYVTVDGINLKEGDTVAFYADAAGSNPESIPVTIGPNMTGQVLIPLDSDALTTQAGTIYVNISGSVIFKPVAYKAEVGFTLDPSAVAVRDDASTDIKIIPADDSYVIDSTVWTLNDNSIASVIGNNSFATITGAMTGNATLTTTVTFNHPDISKDEKVTVIQTAPVYVTDKPMAVIEITLPENPVYDGTPKVISAVSDSDGQVTVQYRPLGGDWTSDDPVKAGTYEVLASVPETTTYLGASLSAFMTIAPLAAELDFSSLKVNDKTYDGTAIAAVTGINVANKIGSDDVTIDEKAVTGVFDNANAGTGKALNITVAAGSLIGSDAANYRFDGETYHTTAAINQRPVDIALNLTKEYGQTLVLDYNSFEVTNGLIGGDRNVNVMAVLTSDGAGAEAKVGTYTVTAVINAASNYTIGNVNASITVTKAVPSALSVSAGNGLAGNTLSSVDTLTGTFENPYSHAAVSGSISWASPDSVLTVGDSEHDWIFIPDDTENYTSPITGKLTVTATDKMPAPITMILPSDLIYNGSPKVVTVETAADAVATVEYRSYGMDETWTKEAPVNAGTYEVRVTVAATGIYGGNSLTGVMAISQAAPLGNAAAVAVKKGSYLNEAQLVNGFTGIDGNVLTGSLTWDKVGGISPEYIIVDDKTSYGWTFVPDDANYGVVTGTLTVPIMCLVTDVMYENGKISFVLNNAQSYSNVTLIAAEYMDGSLIGTAVEKDAAVTSDQQLFSIKYDKHSETSELTLYIWNSIDNGMQPVTDPTIVK